ncbi:TetR/AcrR family transcriptional regulator [Flavobacterium sp.]|jgi:AcrR family transcriptional regulator|uniref:TetR/AcrR family transcriptional regulator n=1 Tax=Flavobacterium sp. TaxID=239 RepID=UPI00286F422E|nr:TetR/AcrR family transcriptional regulator [Flavobacterium sp.]
MKDKIISKASNLFLKLGFKSVTMDDIANEMCISKKTIYKYFCNKEILIEETTETGLKQINQTIAKIVANNHNAIEENFEIIKMFKEMFNSIETSPSYQLKKHYPEIYQKLISQSKTECHSMFQQNIEKGIQEGLYRNELNIQSHVYFYYALISSINENIVSEKESKKLELEALEYHIRAMATPKGIIELEKHLKTPHL